MDAFPDDATETVDTDGDGVGDNSDLFQMTRTNQLTLMEMVWRQLDVFPEDPNESGDTDRDGVGDNTDTFPLMLRNGGDYGDRSTTPMFSEDRMSQRILMEMGWDNADAFSMPLKQWTRMEMSATTQTSFQKIK